jgi:hypothetical protein
VADMAAELNGRRIAILAGGGVERSSWSSRGRRWRTPAPARWSSPSQRRDPGAQPRPRGRRHLRRSTSWSAGVGRRLRGAAPARWDR